MSANNIIAGPGGCISGPGNKFPGGIMPGRRACPTCHGMKVLSGSLCHMCKGHGWVPFGNPFTPTPTDDGGWLNPGTVTDGWGMEDTVGVGTVVNDKLF